MRHLITAAAMLVAATGLTLAQGAAPPDAVKDLAPTGKLRAAINFGNGVLAQKGPNGEAKGVTPELAAELGKRLGVAVELVRLEAAGKAFECLKAEACDIGFIAIEPARASEMEFTPPYVIIEGTYLVPKDSPLKDVGDVDKPGIRIGVGLASVYDLYLTRTLKNATLVRAKIGGAAAGLIPFNEQKLEAAAGVRQPLDAYAKDHPEVRVMPGHFQMIEQAMGTPKGRTAGLKYLTAFVEEMKASGFVAEALKRSGQSAMVAPPAK